MEMQASVLLKCLERHPMGQAKYQASNHHWPALELLQKLKVSVDGLKLFPT